MAASFASFFLAAIISHMNRKGILLNLLESLACKEKVLFVFSLRCCRRGAKSQINKAFPASLLSCFSNAPILIQR
jgi:hypothetical protein